jgi:hypothetical protein
MAAKQNPESGTEPAAEMAYGIAQMADLECQRRVSVRGEGQSSVNLD